MYQRLNKRLEQSRQGGFTLIELLIVIVILGILAAIVVFAVGATRGDATEKACKTDYKSIELGAEAYYTKNGSYPTLAYGSTPPAGSLLKTFPGGSGATADYAFTYASSTNTITVLGTKVVGGTTVDGCKAN